MVKAQIQPEGMMGNSLLIFLFGAAVGASVALLYAPMSGREARSQITEKANQVKDTAGEWKDRAVETAGEWKKKAMSTAHDTLDHAAETIKSASDSVNPNPTTLGARV